MLNFAPSLPSDVQKARVERAPSYTGQRKANQAALLPRQA